MILSVGHARFQEQERALFMPKVVNEGEDAGVEVAFKCNKEVGAAAVCLFFGVVEALANAKEAIVQPKRISTI